APFLNRINKLYEENVGPDLLDKTPEELRVEIRKYISRGIDFIKFAASSHATAENSYLMFSAEAAKVIVEEGHRAGLIVQTHTTNSESLKLATLLGVDMFQHPEVQGVREMPEYLLKLIVDRKIYCGSLFYKKEYVERARAVPGGLPPAL